MSRLNPDGLGGMPPLDPKPPSSRSAVLLRQGLESFDQVLQRTRQASDATPNRPIEPASRDDQDRRRRDDNHDPAASTVDRRDTRPQRPAPEDPDKSARVEERSSRDTSDKDRPEAPSETSSTSRADSSEDPRNASATAADDGQDAAAVDEKASSEADSAGAGAADSETDALKAVVEAEAAIKLVDDATAETNAAAASAGEREEAAANAHPSDTKSRQTDAVRRVVDVVQNAASNAAEVDRASAAGQSQDADKTSQLELAVGVETENRASAAQVDETAVAPEEAAAGESVEGNTPGRIAAQAIEASTAAVVEGETSTGKSRNGGKEKNQPRSAGQRAPAVSTTSHGPAVQTTAAVGQTEAISPVADMESVLAEAGSKTTASPSTEGDNNPSARDGVSTEASRTTAAAARQRAATTDAANQGRQVDRARFVQRVSRAFQGLGQQGGTVRLRLHPAELGSLSLEIRVRDGVMTARLETETAAARTMLLDNLPALRERLAEHDIRVDRFEVKLTDRPGGGAPEQSNDNQQSPDGAPRPAPRSGADATAESEVPARRAVSAASGEGGQLDVVV